MLRTWPERKKVRTSMDDGADSVTPEPTLRSSDHRARAANHPTEHDFRVLFLQSGTQNENRDFCL